MHIFLRTIFTFLFGCLCANMAWSQATHTATFAAPSVASIAVMPAATKACQVLDPELQTSYEGPCSGDGWAHGIGKATGQRAVYEGRFVFGAKQGVGTKTWVDTGDQYTGEFFQDARQGKGSYTWGDASSAKGSRYEGQFQQDLRHGQGSFYWGNGDAVHGQWSQGKQLAPASPMQSLQILHMQAMAKRIRIGQRVCQDSFAYPAQNQVRGTVVSLDGNSMGVRLDQEFASKTLQFQPIIITLLLGWWPC